MSGAIDREPDVESGAPSIGIENDIASFDHRPDEDVLGLRLVQVDDLVRSGVSLIRRHGCRNAGASPRSCTSLA